MRPQLIIISSIVLLQLISCGYSYNTSSDYIRAYNLIKHEKSDTLKVTHTEFTECSDLYVLEGRLSVTAKNDSISTYNSHRDIKVCGQFPLDFIDVQSWKYQGGAKFTIIGKVIMIDTADGIGSIPVFFVEEWSKIK